MRAAPSFRPTSHPTRKPSESIGSWRGLVALLVLAACALGGCATVAPYERERLAKPDMELARNPDAAAGEEHAVNYREGSTGAMGASGGGCGCN